MKKLVALLALLTVFTACNKEEHTDANVHISGTIKGFKKGRLLIKKYNDSTLVTIDSIVVNGNPDFESHLKLDSPEMLYLFIDRGTTESMDNNLMFFAEPGNIKIETTLDRFYSYARITGSKNEEKYEEFKNIKKRFIDEKLDLAKEGMEAGTNKAKLDSVDARLDHNLKMRYLSTINFALNNKNYEVAPYLALSEVPDANTRFLDTIRKTMTPKVAKSLYGRMLTKYVAERKKQDAAPVK